ncbi:MAG: thioredoxin family protein [Proteiniphilum sp.]|uniref:thioredoxin family protein n=1 Tax=Proteiniphilum sp. TaxID=1926877 RepID=UPI002B2045D3|nr:thioredoxin family protein [Proteiniphilum sp.]MEA5126567.1 thioredoxin family protein [Proteiniphilum sp.]
MGNQQTFYLKPWHFLSAILLFTLVMGVLTGKNVRNIPLLVEGDSLLTELNEIDFDKEGTTFLYFYRKDSQLCQKMRYNIEQLDAKNLQGVNFYAMDIEENIEYFYKYNVSGIPNLLIFNGNTEAKRVMGIVSTGNLEKIVERTK